MKHAYLILAHKAPNQLRKLLELLDDTRNDIFVHLDSKSRIRPEDLEGCCRNSALRFISPRIRLHWGGYSIVKAEMALLSEATSCGPYAYYHLLSGQDLPIKDQDTIQDFFDEHQGREFLFLWRFRGHTKRRVHYYTLFPEGLHHFFPRLVNNIAKVTLNALHIRQNKDVDFRFGSQWFSITDDFARYVVDNRAWMDKVFSHTDTMDEIFMPTLLRRSPYWDNLYDPVEHENNTDRFDTGNMRLIDWTRGSSVRHPWTFLSDDWDLLMSVPHLWARKFDEDVDSGIIDRIYNKLKDK